MADRVHQIAEGHAIALFGLFMGGVENLFDRAMLGHVQTPVTIRIRRRSLPPWALWGL